MKKVFSVLAIILGGVSLIIGVYKLIKKIQQYKQHYPKNNLNEAFEPEQPFGL
jgi:hypothetical protein